MTPKRPFSLVGKAADSKSASPRFEPGNGHQRPCILLNNSMCKVLPFPTHKVRDLSIRDEAHEELISMKVAVDLMILDMLGKVLHIWIGKGWPLSELDPSIGVFRDSMINNSPTHITVPECQSLRAMLVSTWDSLADDLKDS